MAKKAMHLRLQARTNTAEARAYSTYRPGLLVAECGHFAPPERCTDDWTLVRCGLCEHTTRYKQLKADIEALTASRRYIRYSLCDAHGHVMWTSGVYVLEPDQTLTIAPGSQNITVN